MSYDSMLDAMLALTIAMSTGNASEGLEAVQNAEQSRTRNSNKLPRDMEPSQEDFEKLGFTFTDIGDDVLFDATLPDGWSLREIPGSSILWMDLIDEKGRVRGEYCYKGAIYDRYGRMSLRRRYRITHQDADPDDSDGPVNIVVTDEDGTVLFNAGQCDRLYCDEYYKLRKEAKSYLQSNYPEHNDVTKYWD